MQIEEERKRFEAWASEQGLHKSLFIGTDYHTYMHFMFEAWQAAKASAWQDLTDVKILGLNAYQIAHLAGFYEAATGIKPHQIFNRTPPAKQEK